MPSISEVSFEFPLFCFPCDFAQEHQKVIHVCILADSVGRIPSAHRLAVLVAVVLLFPFARTSDLA